MTRAYLILEVRLKMVRVQLWIGLVMLVWVGQMAMTGMELGLGDRNGGRLRRWEGSWGRCRWQWQ